MGRGNRCPVFRCTIFAKNKSWNFSFSVLRAPWKRLTPMHDIVSYWEDIDGNKTQFGLTATIYVLTPDGQKIFFTDTGLPVTFNRAFTSPERGAFIIENMSTAASTIFVINKTGKMYTRMSTRKQKAAARRCSPPTKGEREPKMMKSFRSWMPCGPCRCPIGGNRNP